MTVATLKPSVQRRSEQQMRARRLAARDERRSAVLLRADTYRPIQRGNRVVYGRWVSGLWRKAILDAHDDG